MAYRDLCVVMITVPERANICLRTLHQLGGVGIEVDFLSVQQGKVRGEEAHRQNVKRALRASNTQFTLFLEDDLDVAMSFGNALEEAIEANKQVVTFYVSSNLSFYPAPIRRFFQGEGNRPVSGLYRLCNRRRFFGSQSLLLRGDIVCMILDNWERGYFDGRVGVLCDDFWLYFPNPIQHYGAALGSTWSRCGKPHRSISYGLS